MRFKLRRLLSPKCLSIEYAMIDSTGLALKQIGKTNDPAEIVMVTRFFHDEIYVTDRKGIIPTHMCIRTSLDEHISRCYDETNPKRREMVRLIREIQDMRIDSMERDRG